MEKYPMTAAGISELEKELAFLKEEKQVELNEQIKTARGFCDFSEDVSFRDMLTNRTDLEDRIKRLENTLKHAVLMEVGGLSSTVRLGSTVTFCDLFDNDVQTYMIVGQLEANPSEQKISHESPLGSSLLGAKLNEEVSVAVPDGNKKVRIMTIK